MHGVLLPVPYDSFTFRCVLVPPLGAVSLCPDFCCVFPTGEVRRKALSEQGWDPFRAMTRELLRLSLHYISDKLNSLAPEYLSAYTATTRIDLNTFLWLDLRAAQPRQQRRVLVVTKVQ